METDRTLAATSVLEDRVRASSAAELKKDWSVERLLALARNEGLPSTRARRFGCPARCSDAGDTVAVTDSSNGALWNCHRCGIGGSVVDLLQRTRGIDVAGALRELEQLSNVVPIQPVLEREKPDAPALWQKLATSDEASEAYLAGRGLAGAPARFNVGASGNRWLDLRARDGYRLALALFDVTGAIVSLQLRSVVAGVVAKDAKRSLAGVTYPKEGVAMGDVGRARIAERVYLAEGIADTLALQLAGVPVIGAPGVDQLKRLQAFLGKVDGREIVLCPQNDAHAKSQQAFAQLAGKLADQGARVLELATPAPHKDPADWLKAIGREAFAAAAMNDPRARAREPGSDDDVEDEEGTTPEVADVLCQLADAKSAGQLSHEFWCELIDRAALGPADEKRIVDHLGDHLLGVGRRAVAAELRAHRERLGAKDEVEHLESAAHGRKIVEWTPTDLNVVAREIEGELIAGRRVYQVDDAFFTVREDVLPGTRHVDAAARAAGERLPAPQQMLLVPMNREHLVLAVDEAVLFSRFDKRKSAAAAVEQPEKFAKLLLNLPGKRVPRIGGLVSHPLVLSSGRLLEQPGLDSESGLYLSADCSLQLGNRRPSVEEARAAAQRIRELLLADVLLRDAKADGSAFIAALLLGVARKTLDQAAAILVNATIQGSGKTALARILHVVLTGRDMPVSRMSPDATEFKKALFATLVRSPAMACFDNIPDGATLDEASIGPLAGVLTSPVYTDRILGLTAETSVRTNVLFVFTGNNVSVGTDFVRRFLQIDLHAAQANPERRTFQHADLVAYVRAVRAEVLACVLTIQLAWFATGCPRAGDSVGLGEDFDRLVTWPLAFVGEGNLSEKFNQVKDASPEEQGKLELLVALERWQKACAADEGWTAGQICREVGPAVRVGELDLVRQDLIEALGSQRAATSAAVFGKRLAPLLDNPPRQGLALRSRTLHGRVFYSVEVR